MDDFSNRFSWCVLIALLASSPKSALAEPAAPLSALAEMPVKEITVFKDGHTVVTHEGQMPTDAAGNVVMDYLPTPVMGTFWTYAADKDAKLASVVSSRRKVLVPRTALQLHELIEANAGAEAHIVENRGVGEKSTAVEYDATVIGIPSRSSEELESTSPPNSGEMLPVLGDVVLLKTAMGVSAVPLIKIDSITFKGNYEGKLSKAEFRNLLTLRMNWSGEPPRKTNVGMMYLQKGIRWIPQYKVQIDGNGNAVVKLQASIVNDLVDLKDVTAHLVIGVPKFALKGTPDPISMQETFAQLSQSFRDAGLDNSNSFSNAIMSQTAAMAPRMEPESGQTPSEEFGSSGRTEDLFLYTLKHVSLKKGQRMVVPVCESTVKYKDIYTLDIPFAPPPEMRPYFRGAQQSQTDKILSQPKVIHKIRLANKSDYPFTTAPALIVSDGRVLAQGLMTYTAIGASSDLPVTAAVDIKVNKEDKEVLRTPNAVTWRGDQYGKIDLNGLISLTNFSNKAAELEIKRNVLGKVVSADHNGVSEMLNVIEDSTITPEEAYPTWWQWYSWPDWWAHFNGIGRITWKTTLPPNQTVNLNYKWCYFWR